MPGRLPYLNSRLQGYSTTIFAEMSALASATGAINLGQGFPDVDGPPEVADAAVAAIRAGHNQYPPGRGVPSLLAAVSEHQRRWYGLDYDPSTEVLVTAGATEAVTAALLALCEVGDEVVVFEPFYDSYGAGTAMAGARRRTVALRPPEPHRPRWTFDPDELAAAVTPRTRLVLLNSPHNPTGKVFSTDELAAIAEVCRDHDLIAVSDEVYEHLVFDGAHVPLASLPGMKQRTVTVSSAGKTFSFTGWKVGWACGPAALIDAVRTVKQFLTYVNAGPFQHAVAVGLGLPSDRFSAMAAGLRTKRDLLAAGLEDLGLAVLPSEATYFLTTDISPVTDASGVDFCWSLPEKLGVAAVPSAAFYDDAAAGRTLVRWAFCKRDEQLREALRRLAPLGA